MRVLLAILLSVVFSPVFSQAIQSSGAGSGFWDDPLSWSPNTVPTNSNSTSITINENHIITVRDDRAIDQTTINGTVIINSGFTLTISNGAGGTDVTVSSTGTLTNTGTLTINGGTAFNNCKLGVSGIFENSGTVNMLGTSSTSGINFLANSVYDHLFDTSPGAIPQGVVAAMVNWDATSTCRISGYTTNSNPPTGLGQSFGNFQWDTPNLNLGGGIIDLNGQLTNIAGDFIVNTLGINGDILYIGFSNSYSFAVGNDLIINDGLVGFINDPGATVTLDVAGDFVVNGGFVIISTDAADAIIDINGNMALLGGDFDFMVGSGNATVNVAGNVQFNASSISSSGGVTNFQFDGTSQAFSANTIVSGTVNYSVANSTSLALGTSALTGNGSFTNSGVLVLGATDAGGAIQTSTTAGNIRVGGIRDFSSSVRIIYQGAAGQFIGSGHPSTVETEINNAAGVTMASNVAVGNLTLTSGDVTVGAFTLTLNGTLAANGNLIITSSTSSIVINGNGDLGTFPFATGDQTITDFTLNRSSGSVTFANNVTISGALTLTVGNLVFNNQTLTLNGTFSAGSGALSGNSSSTLLIGGDGAFGTLAFASGGNTINTLTFNRGTSGTASLNSSLTITNALNLTNGDFTNTSGLAFSNGAILTRNSAAQLLGADITVAPGEFYNVIYEGGAFNTGLELPTTVDNNLMDLTVNGGPVTLTQDIIINGDVALQNSSLNGNGFDITLVGNPSLWDRQAGSFTPGGSTVYVSGSTTIQGTTASFGNLIVNAGATLSANALLNINNNLQFDAASTFNHNNGIIRFNGSGTQVVAGAGKNLYNIQVNKSGGVVQLSSTVNLINELDIQTSTEVQSNGSLVLISTSDGTSGNARVDALPAGASITGNVTSQRFMSNEGPLYRYISPTVSGAPVSALQDDFPITGPFTGTSFPCTGCTNNASMFSYNETQAGVANTGYVGFPVASNTETLTPGVGYAAYIRQNIISGPVTIDLTGTVNQGAISLPVTYTNNGDVTADGYNLVGNPYPSSIDWDNASGWTKNNMSNTIAVMDNGAGGVFQYWNGTAGGLTNGVIAAGQGFWVQANGLGSPVLQINEAAKVATTGNFYRRRPLEHHVLELMLSKGTIRDRAFYQLSRSSDPDLDDNDARKLDNANFDLSILSEDNIRMAINATDRMPSRRESIRLHIKDMANGTYSFAINKTGKFEDYNYFLLDRYTKQRVDLQQTPEYTFTVTSDIQTSAADRFELFMFRSHPAYGNNEAEDDRISIRVFPNPATDRVYIKVTGGSMKEVVLVDMMGSVKEKITMVGIDEDTWEGYCDLTGRIKGFYMLKVMSANGRISTQKILKK